MLEVKDFYLLHKKKKSISAAGIQHDVLDLIKCFGCRCVSTIFG